MNFTNYLQSKNHSQATIQRIQNDLYYFLDWCQEENIEPEQATYNEIISYINYLQKRKLKTDPTKTIKQRTIQVYTNSLKHYYNWLIKTEVKTENPIQHITIKGVQQKQLYHIIKKQELETLYHNYQNHLPKHHPEKHKNQNWYKASQLSAKRNKIIIGLMIWQALGTKEISKLRVTDVKLRQATIHIAGSRRSNPRELPLEAHQILDLMEYIHHTRKQLLTKNTTTNNQLIISRIGANRLHNTINYLLAQLHKQNPLITSIQQIRTSVITHWLKTHNLRKVQYMAGHRYVSSTEAYLVNNLEELQEDITKYHPL